jgi:hypothetical protein
MAKSPNIAVDSPFSLSARRIVPWLPVRRIGETVTGTGRLSTHAGGKELLVPDARLDALTGVVAKTEGAACWLARLATRAAVVGAIGGAALWWFTMGDRVDDWWRGTAASLLALAVCLAPAAWLLNVRLALHDLVELPDKLSGVATRRMSRPPAPDRPRGGVREAARSIHGLVSDYGDVMGSWGTVAQLVVPTFWFLTLAALSAVPVVVALAAIASLVAR